MRRPTPSLSKSRDECVFTVFSEMNRRAPISRFDRPSAMSTRISCSRGVMPSSCSLVGSGENGPTGGADEDDDVADLAHQIDAARSAKDFAAADALRQRLLDAGYNVLTTKEGTKVEKPLA